MKKTLTKKLAESFLRDKNSILLRDYNLITASAAKELAKYNGSLITDHPPLPVWVIDQINRERSELDLSGLTSLTVASTKALSEHTGDIKLSGIKKLNNASASALSEHKAYIDVSSLSSFGRKDGGLKFAKKLARQKGDLDLRGLKTISKVVAKALSKHNGNLDLRGLSSISSTVASSLSKHNSYIDLSGITTLTNKAAKNLARGSGNISLRGLTSLGESPGHIVFAKKLAGRKGDMILSLPKLTCISPPVAKALSYFCGFLDLGALKNISDEVAFHLSNHQGSILEPGPTELSDQYIWIKRAKKHGFLELSEVIKLSNSYGYQRSAQKLAPFRVAV